LLEGWEAGTLEGSIICRQIAPGSLLEGWEAGTLEGSII
jgi:hypothetical protein